MMELPQARSLRLMTRRVSTVYRKVSGLSHVFKQSRCIPDLKDEALCKASCLFFFFSLLTLEWDKSTCVLQIRRGIHPNANLAAPALPLTITLLV